MKQITCLLIIIYIIVYLTITIYNKPKFEFFNEGASSLPNNNPSLQKYGGMKLSGELETILGKHSQKIINEESYQNTQNRQIRLLKDRVDKLRNDIIIIKSKDKEETNNIYNNYSMDDSISQLPQSVKNRMGLKIPNEIDFNFSIDPTL